MGKIKHSKFRNTGIIFELLSNQVALDVLSGASSTSLDIIKRHFHPKSQLKKELSYYRAIEKSSELKESVSIKLIDSICDDHKKLDKKLLESEKYELVRDIKTKYLLEKFFNARVRSYKLSASIYKLFESLYSGSSTDYVDSYNVLLENIYSQSKPSQITELKTIFTDESVDIQKLTLRLIIERFNSKYSNLNPKQRTLISKFINENTELPPFKSFIYKEVEFVQSELSSYIQRTADTVLKIKLSEVSKLSNDIVTSRVLKDSHINAMLKYYELIKSLKLEQ